MRCKSRKGQRTTSCTYASATKHAKYPAAWSSDWQSSKQYDKYVSKFLAQSEL